MQIIITCFHTFFSVEIIFCVSFYNQYSKFLLYFFNLQYFNYLFYVCILRIIL